MPFYYFPMNSYYMFGYLLVIIGSLIMIYGQIKVNSAYKRYERIPNSRGITGAMVAREILDRNGLSDIQIHVVNGKLSDHYNPRNKPVEFDASSRALRILKANYLTTDEYSGAKSMLSAAAFTYVAAMLSTVLSLLRIVLIVIGNDRD